MNIKPEDVDSIKLPFKVVRKVTNEEFEITKIGIMKGERGVEVSLYCNRFSHAPANVELIKEPEYIPFTQDDWEQFADEWIKFKGSDRIFKAISINNYEIIAANVDKSMTHISYELLVKNYKFAKTNKPCGKLLQE